MLKLLPSCRLSLLLALLQTTSVWAALTAPESAKPGELVRVTSDVEADWIVQPEEYSANVYVDSNKKTLVFASGQPGTVYIFAATSDDGGAPKAQCWRLVITPDAPDNPTPTPPDVEPVNQTLEQIIQKEAQGLDAAQITALADTFQQTVWAIDRGMVTTPAGARETFRRTWIINGTKVNPQTLDALSALVEAISGKIDNTSLASVKRDYNAVIAALRAIK